MTPHDRQDLARRTIPMVLAVLAGAVLTGLAFAAWQSNGPALFEALAASGLSWCL